MAWEHAFANYAALLRHYRDHPELSVEIPFAQLNERQKKGMVAFERELASEAIVISVEPEIMPLLESAATSLPENMILEEADLPTQSGFIHFPVPFQAYGGFRRREDKWVDCYGFLWIILPRGALIGGTTLALPYVWGFYVTPSGFPISFSFFPIGSEFSYEVPSKDARVDEEGRRRVIATLRLLWQEILETQPAKMTRQSRRSLARQNVEPERVITVRLRRRHRLTEETESERVEWTHRWLVGGHWKNQWFSSLRIHRYIWISPYVKGPEDKELVVKQKRYIFTR